MPLEDTETAAELDDPSVAEVEGEDDSLTLLERVLPDSTLGRWGVYLVIVAIVAAVLWFWVFPWLQNLLPPGF